MRKHDRVLLAAVNTREKTHDIADYYLTSGKVHLIAIHVNLDPILANLTDERLFDTLPLSFEHFQLNFRIALLIVFQSQFLDIEPVWGV